MRSVLAEFLFDKQLAFVVRVGVDAVTWLERALELGLIVLSTLQHARIAEFGLKSSVKLAARRELFMQTCIGHLHLLDNVHILNAAAIRIGHPRERVLTFSADRVIHRLCAFITFTCQIISCAFHR